MRLLPQLWHGRHEAFPPLPSDIDSHSHVTAALPTAALVGGLRFGVGVLGAVIRRKPLPWAATLKVTAYSTVGLTGIAALLRSSYGRMSRHFLKTQGVEPPDQPLVDRLAYFDYDNAILLGALSGVLVSSRVNRPWPIAAWKRHVAFSSFGAFLASQVFHAVRFTLSSPEERSRLRAEQHEYNTISKRWLPVVFKFYVGSSRDSQPDGVSASAASLALNVTANAQVGLSGGSSQGNGAVVVGDVGSTNDNIGRDGPHLTITIPAESEPVPMGNTNYRWTSQHAIEDLEKHIIKLRERRQRLAQEAESIWAWLSSKEAEYYNGVKANPAATDDPNQKSAELLYLETLGSLHTKTWSEASLCDWMIADSRKRIEQLKSKESAGGNVTWRAGCSDAAARTEVKFALGLLRVYNDQTTAVKAQLEQMKSQAALEMAGSSPELDTSPNEKVFNPTRNTMTTQRELMQDMRNQLEAALKDATLMQQVVREIIADAEERAK